MRIGFTSKGIWKWKKENPCLLWNYGPKIRGNYSPLDTTNFPYRLSTLDALVFPLEQRWKTSATRSFHDITIGRTRTFLDIPSSLKTKSSPRWAACWSSSSTNATAASTMNRTEFPETKPSPLDNFLKLAKDSNKFLDSHLHPAGSFLLPHKDNDQTTTARDEMIRLIHQWHDQMNEIHESNPIRSQRIRKMLYHGADLCDALLKRLIDESKKQKSIFQSDLTPFHYGIECFRISDRNDACNRSWKILGAWNGLFGGDVDLMPDTEAFNLVLNVYKHCAKNISDAMDAKKIYDLMVVLHQGRNIYVKPNHLSTILVLETMGNVIQYSNSMEEADQVLANATLVFDATMKYISVDDHTSNWKAHVAFLRTNFGFDQCLHQLMTSHQRNTLTEETFASNMEDQWRIKCDQALQKVDSLLLQMDKIFVSSIQNSPELSHTFLNLIHMFGNHDSKNPCRDEKIIDNMKLLFQWMQRDNNQISSIDSIPKLEHYYSAIEFCSQFAMENDQVSSSCRFVHDLLNDVETKFLHSNDTIDNPTKELLGEIFYFYLQMNCRNKTIQNRERTSEALLMQIMTYIHDEKIIISHDKILASLNEVIICWSRCHSNQTKEAAKQVENLLNYSFSHEADNEHRIKPSSASFSAAIHVFARAKNIPKAMEYLKHMEDLCALQKDSKAEEDKIYVRPNIITYTTLLDHVTNVSLALSLWERIENQYNQYQYPSMKPDANAYRAVIDALRRSREPGIAIHAESFLNKMLDQYTHDKKNRAYSNDNDYVKPNKFVFTSVITAWANEKNNPESSERALALLHKMKELKLKPDAILYTAVIKSLRNYKDEQHHQTNVECALQILEFLNKEFHQNNDFSLKPNQITYTEVLKTLLSGKPTFDKFQTAQNLFNQMIDSKDPSLYPSTTTFKVMLGACITFSHNATSNEKIVAGEVANKLIVKYHERVDTIKPAPDDQLYGLLFLAYNSLIANTSHANENNIKMLLRKIIERCCAEGKLSKFIFHNFLELSDNVGFKTENEGKPVRSFDDIPRDWRRNIYRNETRLVQKRQLKNNKKMR